nr:hypothetical protein [Tanacetum cinerariifolium]
MTLVQDGTTCAIVLTRAIYFEGFKTVAYGKNAIERALVESLVVAIPLLDESEYNEETLRFEYETKDKQSKETRNEATTSTKKGNVNSGASLSHEGNIITLKNAFDALKAKNTVFEKDSDQAWDPLEENANLDNEEGNENDEICNTFKLGRNRILFGSVTS